MGRAGPGQGHPGAFFDALGPNGCARITHVSANAADRIASVVADRCGSAVRCADAFHIVAWATDALDEVRRQAWNTARGALPQRRAGRASGTVKAPKHARYALWKNPENLTERQADKLAWNRQDRPPAAPRLPAQGRPAARVRRQRTSRQGSLGQVAVLGSALPDFPFADLARKIAKHRAAIDATLDHDLSNALVESTNTKIRLLTRIAIGFRSPEALIALAMLSLGGYRPDLPGRIVTP